MFSSRPTRGGECVRTRPRISPTFGSSSRARVSEDRPHLRRRRWKERVQQRARLLAAQQAIGECRLQLVERPIAEQELQERQVRKRGRRSPRVEGRQAEIE